MVGFKRLTELCEGLFGLTISQGAISNMLARMGKPSTAPYSRLSPHEGSGYARRRVRRAWHESNWWSQRSQ
jgi:hypothetical protein